MNGNPMARLADLKQTVQDVEEKQITRKQRELYEKANTLKERIAFLRNCLCPVLAKLSEIALRDTPTQFSMNQICKTAGGTAPLYEQLSAIVETIDCTITEVEEIIVNLEI